MHHSGHTWLRVAGSPLSVVSMLCSWAAILIVAAGLIVPRLSSGPPRPPGEAVLRNPAAWLPLGFSATSVLILLCGEWRMRRKQMLWAVLCLLVSCTVIVYAYRSAQYLYDYFIRATSSPPL